MINKTLLISLMFFFVSCKNKETNNHINKVDDIDIQTQNYKPIEHIEYYPTGIPKIKGTLINNEREGKWFSYFEDGRVKSTNNYIHDNLQGASYVFYENGKIFYKGKYANNLKVDTWLYYNQEGKLVKTLKYNKSGEVINEINH